MNKLKTLISGLIICTIILTSVLISIYYLTPRIINSETLKTQIQTVFNEQTGGVLDFRGLKFSLFPTPSLIINQGSSSIPETASAAFHAITIYPKILPLFTGELHIAKIGVESPEIHMEIPVTSYSDKDTTQATIAAAIKQKITALQTALLPIAPDLVAVLEKGSLNLIKADEPFLSLSNINTKVIMQPEGIKINMSCSSSDWKHMSITLNLDPEDFSGSAQVDLVNFSPKELTKKLFPDDGLRIEDSQINLYLNITIDDINNVKAEADGSIDYLALKINDKQTTIKSNHIKATINIDKNKSAINLNEMNLDYPQLSLSGELIMDKKSKQIGVTLKGREVDVDSTREAALSLSGGNSTVNDIFNILRGGTVPFIKFTSNGNTVNDLYRTENFVINGALREGRIYVPGPDLDLHNVKGDVVVKQGILEGSDVDSELENARGTKGRIRIGLIGKDVPLHIETIVTTDLGQLPPLLRRLVKNEAFLKEINSIDKVKGMATGKLTLGERVDSIKVGVDIFEINLSADYRRLPYPLKIKEGQFSYDEASISVKNMRGELGSSSFSNLNARLSLGQDKILKINSGKASVVMDEMYPWITSFEGPDVSLETFKAMKGMVDITSMTLKGPLLRPENWHYSGRGDIKSLVMETTILPDSIKVTKGEFDIDEEKILFTNNRVNIMDASLSVSGTLDRYMEGIHKADLTFSGDAGAETTEWASDLINLPPELRVRPPISISQAHLIWEKDNITSVKGDFIFQKGAALTLDILGHSNELIINNLHIQDNDSDAALALTHKGKTYDFKFTGNLTKPTLDKIYMRNILVNSWVKGDFTAHISTDQPMRSSFQGKLEGKDFIFPWELKVPLIVNSISLDAGNNKVRVDSAELMFGNSPLSLKGDITTSEKAFLFDMYVSTDGIKWDNIKKAFETDKEVEKTKLFGDLPIKGTLRLDADYFTFDRYTWKPFRANISFDQEYADITITDADLCGISFPGVMKVTHEELLLDFQPEAANKEIEPAIACLFDISKYMTGTFDLNGEVTTKGNSESLVNSLNGDLSALAKDGRIYQYGLISKLFGFLNLTETFRGRLPDLVNEGFAYQTITASADIYGSSMNIREFVIDGSSMEIVSHGNIDFVDNIVDLQVLVAPLKTVDFIIKKTPVIGGILGGTLVSIPVRIKGDISNPNVSYLSAATAGSRLLDIMKNTLKTPVRIIEPIIPGVKEKE